ncbi:hypothetical protein RV11_GL001355 [Enterococcus phoeniculicola]|jgi:hypothetical protein|nr:hypothetical protein RV11_GL001355 [Enterococcus phoeniculicola]
MSGTPVSLMSCLIFPNSGENKRYFMIQKAEYLLNGQLKGSRNQIPHTP